MQHTAAATEITFSLHFLPYPAPISRRYTHFDTQTIARYNDLLAAGFSFAAYNGQAAVGLLIGERMAWNRTLIIWEFHVAAEWRRRGIGRRLMERAETAARAAGLRALVCETQQNNAGAIFAYRRLGFRLEGVDISYYSNDDYPDGDIAIFMKRRL